jgi:nucleotide-binding universal stress UspA family protein
MNIFPNTVNPTNMRTILVPTDFSLAAENAVQYAAQLAKKINGKVIIANLKLVDNLETAPPLEYCRYIRNEPQILEEMSDAIKSKYEIDCSFIAERTEHSLQNAIEKLSIESDLIVMGTNGADDLYSLFFGTNTYHVITKVKCPVLVVPEGVSYKPIEKIIFAWDYTNNNEKAFSQMLNLLQGYHPQIILLHISQDKTAVSEEVFKAIKDKIESGVGRNENILFAREFSKDKGYFADFIHESMEDEDADLLSITYYDRALLPKLFHGSITKRISEAANYPLLVLHV